MEELHKQKNAKTESVLVSQIQYTACMIYHGVARTSIDCQAGMFSLLFPDSNIAKVYDIRRNLQNLQKRLYSSNFDESTVNGDSQLDINLSYLTEE